jgi:hypothetical protein
MVECKPTKFEIRVQVPTTIDGIIEKDHKMDDSG